MDDSISSIIDGMQTDDIVALEIVRGDADYTETMLSHPKVKHLTTIDPYSDRYAALDTKFPGAHRHLAMSSFKSMFFFDDGTLDLVVIVRGDNQDEFERDVKTYTRKLKPNGVLVVYDPKNVRFYT